MSLLHKVFNRIRPERKDREYMTYNHIDLYFWSPPSGGLNFGDHLSKIIVNKVLADHNYMLEEEVKQSRRLLALGSVLHFAKDNDVIWGTGVNGKVDLSEHTYYQLDVRAVRGPLTRNFLLERGIEAPAVYGDPALLIPSLFPGRFKRTSKKDYVVVPNLHDMSIVQNSNAENIVSPLSSWNRCISDILEADFVIASSLHGLIIAEAYGIPARYLRLSETENLFKYNDYMMGTGRDEIEPATSLAEALKMGGMKAPLFDSQKLLNAFPTDLWD
ncbi:pyruvyl transferase [Arcticibacter tournemirensis]|uniref:Polysaccharide pyruvyl transferase family protein n=1 Tax=Arcticibacter tournemirensis TaxID=699437 RepID=A0A5M9H777_9SPHI|nr:polysaccharide pyruvyl transferase family protein [Arcticibacter tournemirensis]KAA8482793.1 polysaccharide pyruvyl transferase family protein [Arcticibacter tournemirensis]TQM51094.1 pyruvyl transferase [Arcticibacter tournemirensis]